MSVSEVRGQAKGIAVLVQLGCAAVWGFTEQALHLGLFLFTLPLLRVIRHLWWSKGEHRSGVRLTGANILYNIHTDTYKANGVEDVGHEGVFDFLVHGGGGGEGGRHVDLQDPSLQVLVQEDVKAKHLKAWATRSVGVPGRGESSESVSQQETNNQCNTHIHTLKPCTVRESSG